MPIQHKRRISQLRIVPPSITENNRSCLEENKVQCIFDNVGIITEKKGFNGSK